MKLFIFFVFVGFIQCKASSEGRTLSLLVNLLKEDQSKTSEDDLVKIIDDIERVEREKITSSNRRFPEDIQGFVNVSTSTGLYIGQTNSHSHAFFSIPFAQPPVGELRYMPPQPLKESNAQLNVSIYQDIVCFQKCNLNCPNSYKEDCLVLNIFVPKDVDFEAPFSRLLPVMFFIHGGGFQIGSGNDATFDSRLLANVTNTVVVVINYRLGPLGFLVYEEDGLVLGGNQGLKDQQMALKWVQDNIGYFGGDKTKVTIFGQSAGAQSVLFHLLSPVSGPLFSRAISESPPSVFQYDDATKSISSTNQLVNVLSNKLTNKHCRNESDPLSCLRYSDPSAVMAAATNVQVWCFFQKDVFGVVEPFRPIIDYDEFENQPLELFKNGIWNKEKEVITGTTSDELAQAIIIFRNFDVKWRLFQTLNQLVLGEELGEIVSNKYREDSNIELSDSNYDYTRIMTNELNDLFFSCPTRLMTRFISKTAKKIETNFMYIDYHPGNDPSCSSPNETRYPCGYAFHSSELSYVFRTGPSEGKNFSDDDFLVSDIFSDYWGSFAYDGKPSSSRFSVWPIYQKDADSNWLNVRIDANQQELDANYKSDICDFWDSTNFYVNMGNKSLKLHGNAFTIYLFSFSLIFLTYF